MFEAIPEQDLRIDKVSPAGADTEYKMTITHIPTGTVVTDVGPSTYRLKRDLIEKLTLEIFGYSNG